MLKEYSTDKIRNIAILGHSNTGKSTLLEALLFMGGQIPKMGNAADGTLVSDFDIEEKKKKMSVHTAMGFIEVDDYKINIIDCPGHADFIGERRAAVQATDAAILVVDSVDGVQVQTEKAWRYLSENKIPCIIFVNKMDQERASYKTAIGNIENSLHANLVSLCIPIGDASAFEGVVDILSQKAMRPKSQDSKDVVYSDIPADLAEIVKQERQKGAELAAEGDDELIEMFLEGKELDETQIRRGIKEQIIENKLQPVICGSAMKHIGIKTLIDIIVKYIPGPDEKAETMANDLNRNGDTVLVACKSDAKFAAVCWKTYWDQYAGRSNYVRIISGSIGPDTEILNTDLNEYEKITKIYSMIGKDLKEVQKLNAGDIGVFVKLEKTSTSHTLTDSNAPLKIPIINLPHPVFGYAIHAAAKKDNDKLGQILNKYADQDPTVTYEYNAETRQSVFSGMGQLHLDILLDEIKEKYKIDFIIDIPRIAYRETITKSAQAQYKHKKQSGGHGQYGEVYLKIDPMPRGGGFEFSESIVGGVVPKNYIPGIEKGVREALEEGIIAKYPVVDVKANLFDGSYHPVDSSEMAFKIAALHAFKIAMENGNPLLLEPIMEVGIFVDKKYMGDIMGDITARRGRVLGMDTKDESSSEGITVIKALVPKAEMLRYSIDLKALTSNNAVFEMKFSHYDPITGKIAEKVIEERMKMLAEEE
ncbi:MAG: elongation factor G [Spirochaetes bacterium]|nr:elongation factor G [Spirochaetota bacterium]